MEMMHRNSWPQLWPQQKLVEAQPCWPCFLHPGLLRPPWVQQGSKSAL